MQKKGMFFCIGIALLVSVIIGCGGGGDNPTPPQASGSATLTWTAPTTDVGGGALTGLSGYYAYYGTSARTDADPKVCGMCGYTTKTAGISETRLTINNLASGTYYFSITAYDPSGNESVFSNEGTKTIP